MPAPANPLLHAILPESFSGRALQAAAANLEAAIEAAVGEPVVDVDVDGSGIGLIRAVSLDHTVLIVGLPSGGDWQPTAAELKEFVEEQQTQVFEQFESMLGATTLAAWRTAVVGGDRWYLHYTASSGGTYSFHGHPAHYPAVLPPKPAAIRYFLRRHVFQLGQ